MRRFVILLLCIVTLGCLCISASAATNISSMKTQVTVSSDSTCQVTTQVTIHLDQPVEKLYFPVPEKATAIAVNGSRVLASSQGGTRSVDLSRILSGLVGDFSLTISYRMSDLVEKNRDGLLQLTLPLLSGFSYPVRSFELSALMPGPLQNRPSFISGYHQANIEKDLLFTVDGATITCRSQTALKDHETLQMVLNVSEEMFPQSIIQVPELEATNVAAIVCGVLALLYWLLTLRFLIPIWFSRATPPEGFTAGEIGSILHLRGADLSLMVLTWAQQGYLVVEQKTPGHITLRKQMDMGNECTLFQRKCFNSLFSKKSVVDTGSAFYAQQYGKVAAMAPNVQGFIRKASGNRKIFHILASLCGMFIGISMGAAISAEAAAPWFVFIALGAFGYFSSHYCLTWAYGLIQTDRRRGWVCGGLLVLWLMLGLFSAQLQLALWAVAMLLLFGLMNAFAGRRTREGRHVFSETLGLRRYLRRVSSKYIIGICRDNPDYFHDLAPYALALGVERPFAKAFGSLHTGCPYIADPRMPSLSAVQWCHYLRQLLDSMNARVQKAPTERALKILKSLKP